MTNLVGLKSGTELVGDYRIARVLGAGGFGVTYLAEEIALGRDVTIKEYFPADFAVRNEQFEAVPRSENSAGDYAWGLERFIEEAQTLARFDHPNIVRVYRYFRANKTGYMVLNFEEGQSLKSWLKSLGRAPRQKELDQILAPLLDALDVIHKADFLHRDIAPDNIIIRKDGAPVLIDFGSARGEIAAHSKTVSALVKPGYSPYEQYAETGKQQGPWTDIYALGATLYHLVTGKRPPDAPSRMVKDELVSAREAAVGAYRAGFLKAIDRALALNIDQRPQTVAAWRGDLFAPDPKPASWLQRSRGKAPSADKDARAGEIPQVPIPDAPGPQGQLLDLVDGLKHKQAAGKPVPAAAGAPPQKAESKSPEGTGAQANKPAAAIKPAVDAKSAKPKRASYFARLFERGSAPAPAQTPASPPRVSGQNLAPAVFAPAATPKNKPVRPKKIRSRPIAWRPLAFKFLVGVGIASGAVALQDRLPRIETRSATVASSATASNTTTGSIVRTAAQPISPLAQLRGHSGAVSALAYTSDGDTIVSAAADASVKLWDAASATLKRTIELDDGPATALAIDGRRILTGHANGTTVLWDIDSADKIATFKRNDAEIWSVTFLGGPERFATAAHDWKIALWETAAPSAPSHVLEAHENAVQAMTYALAPAGPMLVSGGADKTLRLWNVETLERVRTLRGHRDYITAVAFAPAAKDVASSSLDGNVRIWSGRTGRLQRSLSGHQGRASALAFAPSGDVLATAGADGKIRVWDYKRRRTPRTLPSHDGEVKAIAFSPDGRFIASAGDDGLVRVWANPLVRPVTN
jgi:serine/threonine protein kinase